ncbi:M48 family metallopeptidase [Mucilaginibacter aquatilis]|uniref:M48 family metalloprotease n=1 Tax=Mucilaginibacter aquatilis TaxID=1517760 RepID=A0A6I4IC08_9SPHI|nr:M48 family metallopeptidase [Mucilaginibacter aquatilis]MVN92800.1 M48 family metalloprotease [Mucilaginibacter aquatilis]
MNISQSTSILQPLNHIIYPLRNYQAIIIHPDVPGGRCSGSLHIDTLAAVFSSDAFTYKIPLSALNISAGGAGNRFIFLKNESQSQISIYTSDKAILKDPVLQSDSQFSPQINEARKTLGSLITGSLLVVVLLLGLIGALYLLKDKMVEGLASRVPASWERAAGDKLFNALSLQYKFIQNDSLKKEFMRVGAPLFKQVEKEGYPVSLYFVKDPSINAFALPGGKVIIQSGLIDNAKSWEEVMGVLGHELAHVTRRHHIRGIINNVGIYTILAATLGDVSALAGTFASFGGDLASLSNSRTFENEADETGWDYLVKARINPKGLISFFETLKKDNQSKMDTLVNKNVDLSFLSTHPNTDDRIAHLKKKQKETKGSFNPLPDTFADFKKKLLNKY